MHVKAWLFEVIDEPVGYSRTNWTGSCEAQEGRGSEAGQRSAVVEAVGIAVQLVLGREGK